MKELLVPSVTGKYGIYDGAFFRDAVPTSIEQWVVEGQVNAGSSSLEGWRGYTSMVVIASSYSLVRFSHLSPCCGPPTAWSLLT